MSSHEIALFPLPSVLFPGGELPLQIFEQRYLEMVRDCTRTESSFGTCLTLNDQARYAQTGTAARICDWYTRENGLLGIMCRGTQRFHITRTRTRENGLIIAQVDWLKPEPPVILPLEYSVLSTIVARYMEQAREQFPEFKPMQLENAVFVAYRLAEILPISNEQKQSLLEMEDVLQRLDVLQCALPGFQQ